jgi:hypothetical protein
VLLQADAERLVHWGFEQRFNQSRLAEPKAVPVGTAWFEFDPLHCLDPAPGLGPRQFVSSR